jgi:hypothetical protein
LRLKRKEKEPSVSESTGNVGDLPRNDDKEFWGEADTNINKLRPMPKCDHLFRHKDAHLVMCSCGIGFILGVDWELKDGHIYSKKQLII